MQQQEEEFKKQQEMLHSPQNIRNSVLTMSLPEDKREEFIKQYISGGYADKDGTTSMFKRDKFLGEHTQGVDFWFGSMKENARNVFDKSIQANQKAMISGDPVAMQKTQKEMQNAAGYLASIDGKHKDAMALLTGKGTAPILKNVPGVGLVQVTPGEDAESTTAEVIQPSENKDNDIELRRKALAGDKESKAILDSQMADKLKLAAEGRAVFANMPTNTPGVSFERKTGRYFKTDVTGNKHYISSDTTREERLRFIEDQPVTNLKTMQQSAPHVLGLVESTRSSLEKAKDDMGPIKGRFSEFMAGKVGTTNKEWIAIRTNTKLLETRLMNMHVGARGGEYILKHFENIFAFGYQSPENMIQALDDVETYARQVKRSKFGADAEPPSGGGVSREDALTELKRRGIVK
jgi:hypothetical protein